MKYALRTMFISCAGIWLLTYLIHYQYVTQQRQDIAHVLATSAQTPQGQATWQFQEKIFDFGKIEVGSIVKRDYLFTNTGTQPLVIHEVIPSCKLCMKASASQLVVHPGKQGAIMVEFNSAGRSGNQGKYVTIWSNTADSPTRVLIKGEIR